MDKSSGHKVILGNETKHPSFCWRMLMEIFLNQTIWWKMNNSMKNYFHSVILFLAEIGTRQDGELHFYLIMCMIIIGRGHQTDRKRI